MAHPADNSAVDKAVDEIRTYERTQAAAAAADQIATITAERDYWETKYEDHMSSAHPSTPTDPVKPPFQFGRRGYVIQQVQSVAELKNYASQFANVKATVPGCNGLGIRVPWNSYDREPSILQTGFQMSTAYPHYSERIMCGKHTPAAKMGTTLNASGVTFPSPFAGSTGAPNKAFLDQLEATMRAWAEHLESTGQPNPILHWSWYAKEWAEIYHGPEVRAAAGYSKERFVAAHCAVIERAAKVQQTYPDILMEFPLSGHGPIQDIVDDMAKCMADAFGDERSALQANGWSHSGQWGQANPEIDEQMDAAFDVAKAYKVLVGVQAIQPWGVSATYPQYTDAQITAAFQQADAAGARYFEIYTPTFLSANSGSKWARPVAAWVAAA